MYFIPALLDQNCVLCATFKRVDIVFREALGPAEEMVSLAPQETPAPLDLQDLMDPLDLAE